jgi:2-amino-4-hydroxy-6-hydroxymethyldihydropteridine diphosphokinase
VSQTIHIGLGSNLGDREQNLTLAVQALSRIDAVAVLRRSSLYDSAPQGPEQPRFLNAVVELDCELAPERLLAITKHIEGELGRTAGTRWGPRIIDLDLLLWGDQIVAAPGLQVPHLQLHTRRFVLEPVCELSPFAIHPVFGKTMRELLSAVASQDVLRLESFGWPDREEHP